jgi:hypothetical protein
MFHTWTEKDEGTNLGNREDMGTFPVIAPPVAMSSLKDDNLGRVHSRWDGTNEVNPRGCHMAFDQ